MGDRRWQDEGARENLEKISGGGFLSRVRRWALAAHLIPPVGQNGGSHAAKESGRVGYPILVPGGLLAPPLLAAGPSGKIT